jgi:hypothetical protein
MHAQLARNWRSCRSSWPTSPSYHPLQLGEKLAEHLPSLWDGQQLQLLLPCVPAPEALCTLLLGSLEQLAEVLHALSLLYAATCH